MAHHHGGGGGGAAAGIDLLPQPVLVGWFVVTAGIAAVQAGRSLGAPRGSRAASGCHALMAAGMAYMFKPFDASPIPWQDAGAVFLVAAVVAAGATTRIGWSHAAGFVAMAFMFGSVGGTWSPINFGLTAAFGVAAVHAAWTAGGVVDRVACALMNLAMAHMFLAMCPRGPAFADRAFTEGLTEQTWWAIGFGLLLLRLAADPRLVRSVALQRG